MTAEVNVNLMISFENLFKSTTRRLIKHNRNVNRLPPEVMNAWAIHMKAILINLIC
ncbi:MAG: hypothetical protein ACKERF_01655 [Candidatus Hodgkinia cicadicola]